MKKLVLLAGLLLALNSESRILSAEEAIYQVYRMCGEPVMDGELNDIVWKKLPVSGPFFRVVTNNTAPKQTSFRIGYTDESLFIGVRCEEPEQEKIRAELADMEDIFGEDSIEIFIFPADADTYYQFAVNAIGSRWNGIGIGGKKPLWDWHARTSRGKDYWSIEIEIPFEIFRILPEKEEEWRINICRNIPAYGKREDKHSSWSPVKLSFHDLDGFGKIIFIDKKGEI